jgi:hypothetical protein
MSNFLSVKRLANPRRHSADISGVLKVKDYSDASGFLVPKPMSRSAGNSAQSLNTSSNSSISHTVSPPSPASGKKTVSFNNRVQLFDYATWKKQLKRYRKIARKLAIKREEALKEVKEKAVNDSDDSSSEDETTKTEESSSTPTPVRTPPRSSSSSRAQPTISIN